jgi:hypothetical protein
MIFINNKRRSCFKDLPYVVSYVLLQVSQVSSVIDVAYNSNLNSTW